MISHSFTQRLKAEGICILSRKRVCPGLPRSLEAYPSWLPGESCVDQIACDVESLVLPPVQQMQGIRWRMD